MGVFERQAFERPARDRRHAAGAIGHLHDPAAAVPVETPRRTVAHSPNTCSSRARAPSGRSRDQDGSRLAGAEFNAFPSRSTRATTSSARRTTGTVRWMCSSTSPQLDSNERSAREGDRRGDEHVLRHASRLHIGGGYDQPSTETSRSAGTSSATRKRSGCEPRHLLDYVGRWYKPVRMVVGLGGWRENDALATVRTCSTWSDPDTSAR